MDGNTRMGAPGIAEANPNLPLAFCIRASFWPINRQPIKPQFLPRGVSRENTAIKQVAIDAQIMPSDNAKYK